MAIAVTAPRTVDDADTTFYYDEDNYVLEEAEEGEVIPSELLKLVKCPS